MAETIRHTRMHGVDLATNLEFHYGLVNWFIGQNINARPTTRFIVPYLTAVGELKEQANSIDLSYAYKQISRSLMVGVEGGAASALGETLQMKESLLLRPLQRLLDQSFICDQSTFADTFTSNFKLGLHQKHAPRIFCAEPQSGFGGECE